MPTFFIWTFFAFQAVKNGPWFYILLQKEYLMLHQSYNNNNNKSRNQITLVIFLSSTVSGSKDSFGGFVEMMIFFFSSSGEGSLVNLWSLSGRSSMSWNVLFTIYKINSFVSFLSVMGKNNQDSRNRKVLFLLTSATLSRSFLLRWSSKVITTGYSEAWKA